MLTLNEIFARPAQTKDLTDWVIREDWFEEIRAFWESSSELFEKLQRDGRLVVKEVAFRYVDHRRYAGMYSLWFDGKPIALVQNAGREGDDHKNRWVTDKQGWTACLQYLVEVLSNMNEWDVEVEDPAALRYEEEVLFFYGIDFATELGYSTTPARTDVLVLGNERDIFKGVPSSGALAFLKEGAADLPEYVRRHAWVMKVVRQMSETELAACNEQILEHNRKDGIDRVYLLEPCQRPENAFVQPI